MPKGYVIERQLEDTVGLPLSLPATRVEPGSQLVLSSVQLSGPKQRLYHRFVQIKVLEVSPASAAPAHSGAAYASGGIYDKAGVLLASSSTDVAESLPSTAVGPASPVSIEGPSSGSDEYTYRVVNNCTAAALVLTVSGAWRVDLNA